MLCIHYINYIFTEYSKSFKRIIRLVKLETKQQQPCRQLTRQRWWHCPLSRGFRDTSRDRHAHRTTPDVPQGMLGNRNRRASRRDDRRFLARLRPNVMLSRPSWTHAGPCHGSTRTTWFLAGQRWRVKRCRNCDQTQQCWY